MEITEVNIELHNEMLISTAGALPTTNDNNKLSQIFTEISSDILQAIIKFLFIMNTNKSEITPPTTTCHCLKV